MARAAGCIVLAWMGLLAAQPGHAWSGSRDADLDGVINSSAKLRCASGDGTMLSLGVDAGKVISIHYAASSVTPAQSVHECDLMASRGDGISTWKDQSHGVVITLPDDLKQ